MTRPGRCICGLLIKHHFTPDNRKLTCEGAAAAHPRARRVSGVFERALRVHAVREAMK